MSLFGPGGRTIALAVRSVRGHVRTRLYRAFRLVRVLPQLGVSALEFSARGQFLATGSHDGTVDLWQVRTGRLVQVLDNGGAVNDIVFSRDGSLLAVASGDGAVRVWDTRTGQRTFLFVNHGAGVLQVAFDPSGAYLASASEDHTARIWATGGIAAGRPVALLAPHRGAVTAVAFSPDGRTLLTASADGAARLWDARIEQQLRVVARDPSTVASATFAGPGLFADVTAATLQRRRDGRVVRSFPLAGRLNAFSADGRLVASAGAAPRARVAEVATGHEVAALRTPGEITALAFRRDGQELVTASYGGAVRVWDVRSRRVLTRIDALTPVVAVALSPSGSEILTGGADGSARIWARDGKLRHVLRGHQQPITDARFSADGRRLVTASMGSSQNAIEWDAASGRALHALVGQFGTVSAASFSADGRWILTAGPISAAIWSASTGRLLFYLRGPTDLLTDAEWAPTGFRVVTAARDGTIRTYTCEVCRPLAGLVAFARARLARLAVR